jgi:hypothetical protein
MLDDRRLDERMTELTRELLTRPLVPRFPVVDAIAIRGVDEMGKAGLYAAVLLSPGPTPEFNTLTTFRGILTQKLKQLDSTMPAWPIVVQGSPEFSGNQLVVPGGREYFDQLKAELNSRKGPSRTQSLSQMPAPVLLPEAPTSQADRPQVNARSKRTAKPAAARSARVVRSR